MMNFEGLWCRVVFVFHSYEIKYIIYEYIQFNFWFFIKYMKKNVYRNL